MEENPNTGKYEYKWQIRAALIAALVALAGNWYTGYEASLKRSSLNLT